MFHHLSGHDWFLDQTKPVQHLSLFICLFGWLDISTTGKHDKICWPIFQPSSHEHENTFRQARGKRLRFSRAKQGEAGSTTSL
jgi:hypothetical protein